MSLISWFTGRNKRWFLIDLKKNEVIYTFMLPNDYHYAEREARRFMDRVIGFYDFCDYELVNQDNKNWKHVIEEYLV